MGGAILELAKRDAKRITTSLGFQESIVLMTPDKSTTLSLTGLASKHNLGFDLDGNPVNSKTVHITIDENILVEAGYPVRNLKNEVHLLRHFVAYADSTGVSKNYVVTENMPDETLGLITLILGDFKP